jgi:hypothetical protein
MEREQKEELERFNEKWDQDFFELTTRFNEQEAKIRETQNIEIQEKIEEFEKTYNPNPKPSVEVLNLNKLLEQAVKLKE